MRARRDDRAVERVDERRHGRCRSRRHLDDVGETALAVWTSPSRAWLLELTSRCPDLEHSYGIGFDSRDGRIDAGFDSVVPLSQPGVQIPCRIGSIHRIDVEALRAAERAQDSGL